MKIETKNINGMKIETNTLFLENYHHGIKILAKTQVDTTYV